MLDSGSLHVSADSAQSTGDENGDQRDFHGVHSGVTGGGFALAQHIDLVAELGIFHHDG